MSNYQIFLNMIIVSIPEEFIITLIALVIMGRYDYLDKYTIGYSLKRVFFIVVIPYAILTTGTLYIFDINLYIRIIINFIGFNTCLIILLKGDTIFKIFTSALLSTAIIFLSEVFTLLAFIYIFNFDFSLMNTSPWINFLINAPFRIIQISILYMVYIKKNSIIRFKVFEIWNNNGIFKRFMLVYIGFNIFILVYIYNKFASEKGLENLPVEIRLSIVIIVFILYVVELVLPWVMMYVVYPSEKLRKKI